VGRGDRAQAGQSGAALLGLGSPERWTPAACLARLRRPGPALG